MKICKHGAIVEEYGKKKPCSSCDGEGAVRRSDPATSYEAARSVDVQNAETRFLEALRSIGGEGCNRCLAEAMGVERGTISPRVKPLKDQGRIAVVGKHNHDGVNYQSYVVRKAA